MTKITGHTLIDLGYEPGKWFGAALKQCNEHSLSGKELINYLDSVKPKPIVQIQPHTTPAPYGIYLDDPVSEDEKANYEQVLKTMEEVMKTPTVIEGAIMPDACPAGPVGTIPVGGVVVADSAIHPSMHSADICCSVYATKLPKDFRFGDDIDDVCKQVLNAAFNITHFGKGGRNTPLIDLPLTLQLMMEENLYLNDQHIIQMAKSHMSTQGDGNHFLFVGYDEQGEVWIVTHHGSRGVGAALYKKGRAVAERFRKKLSPNTPKHNGWIPFDTQEGKQYWDALQIVKDWTYLNHKSIHNAILRAVMNTDDELSTIYNTIWNTHNFVYRDKSNLTHFYHAKGATPMSYDLISDLNDLVYSSKRLIPLNMTQPILVVEPVNRSSLSQSVGFAPHGAGRLISRTQHKKNNQHKTAEQLLQKETDGYDIRFFGEPDISELPSAYKNAHQIVDQIERYFGDETVITNRIYPYGSIMAGNIKQLKKS